MSYSIIGYPSLGYDRMALIRKDSGDDDTILATAEKGKNARYGDRWQVVDVLGGTGEGMGSDRRRAIDIMIEMVSAAVGRDIDVEVDMKGWRQIDDFLKAREQVNHRYNFALEKAKAEAELKQHIAEGQLFTKELQQAVQDVLSGKTINDLFSDLTDAITGVQHKRNALITELRGDDVDVDEKRVDGKPIYAEPGTAWCMYCDNIKLRKDMAWNDAGEFKCTECEVAKLEDGEYNE